jgi:hypothetical protein
VVVHWVRLVRVRGRLATGCAWLGLGVG